MDLDEKERCVAQLAKGLGPPPYLPLRFLKRAGRELFKRLTDYMCAIPYMSRL